MSRRPSRELLRLYLEGHATRAEEEAVEEAVAQDPAVAAELAELARELRGGKDPTRSSVPRDPESTAEHPALQEREANEVLTMDQEVEPPEAADVEPSEPVLGWLLSWRALALALAVGALVAGLAMDPGRDPLLMPTFHLELGGQRGAAGSDGDTLQAETGSELMVVARPSADPPGPVKAVAFIERRGEVLPATRQSVVALMGPLRLRLQLPDEPGAAEIVVVVGPADSPVPDLGGAGLGGWVELRQHIEVVGPPEAD